MSREYLEREKFRTDKLLLRLQQCKDHKKEILKHIEINKNEFIGFMEDLINLENSNELYHLEHYYNENSKIDIIQAQMNIIDDETKGITKMMSFCKYYKSLEEEDRTNIINVLLDIKEEVKEDVKEVS